jgi:hypothetical protein
MWERLSVAVKHLMVIANCKLQIDNWADEFIAYQFAICNLHFAIFPR